MVGRTDLVCFVVVLRVVLEHFWFLRIVECLGQAVCTEFFAPFFIRNEPRECESFDKLVIHESILSHLLGQFHVKLSSPEKAQHRQCIQSLGKALLLEHLSQLMYLRILFLGSVAWMPRLVFGSSSGKIVVIVLGIEVHVRSLPRDFLRSFRHVSFVGCCSKLSMAGSDWGGLAEFGLAAVSATALSAQVFLLVRQIEDMNRKGALHLSAEVIM